MAPTGRRSRGPWSCLPGSSSARSAWRPAAGSRPRSCLPSRSFLPSSSWFEPPMKLAVLRERDPGEPRVAASPETVKRFKALGFDVAVEAGAGLGSGLPDQDYAAAGAGIAPDSRAALGGADVILAVRRPDPETLGSAKPSALLIGLPDPYG